MAATNSKVDRELTHAEIEQADCVVTAALCAIADSGTIALYHSLLKAAEY